MNESLQLYFNAFKNFPAKHDGEISGNNAKEKLSFAELLGISWALQMIHGLYSVITIYLGIMSFDYFSNSKNFTHLMFESLSFQFQKMSLITILFEVVFYPFIFQFAYKFWNACFKFYSQIFEHDDPNFEEKSQEVLTSVFSANLFLLLPILGNVLSNIAFCFFLFRAMKSKFEFTSLQASLVLISPLFLLFLFAIFSASYFVFLITLL